LFLQKVQKSYGENQNKKYCIYMILYSEVIVFNFLSRKRLFKINF